MKESFQVPNDDAGDTRKISGSSNEIARSGGNKRTAT